MNIVIFLGVETGKEREILNTFQQRRQKSQSKSFQVSSASLWATKYLDSELLSLSEDLWVGLHARRTFETDLVI